MATIGTFALYHKIVEPKTDGEENVTWRLRNKAALQVQELIESQKVGKIMKVAVGEIKDMLWGLEPANRGWRK